MKKLKQSAVVALAAVVFVLMLGIVGTYDKADIIVSNMSDQTYILISQKLGKDASTVDIAREYEKNKSYYDNLMK